MPDNPKPASELLLYRTEDGSTRLEVRLENETVWLSQSQMAELFQTTQQNVSLHLRNLYREGELQPEATHKEYLLVQPTSSLPDPPALPLLVTQTHPYARIVHATLRGPEAFTCAAVRPRDNRRDGRVYGPVVRAPA
jgi:hypothetical protein